MTGARHPPGCPGFAQLDVLVLGIGQRPNSGGATRQHPALLPRRQLHDGIPVCACEHGDTIETCPCVDAHRQSLSLPLAAALAGQPASMVQVVPAV